MMVNFLKAMSFCLLITSILLPIEITAEELSKFSAIHSSVLEDYNTYAYKFTHLGTQTRIIPTIGGNGLGRDFDIADFTPFRRRSHDYGNDDFGAISVLSLSNKEFKNFVDAIARHPELHGIDDMTDPDQSLMIIRDFGESTMYWEHLSTYEETGRFFDFLYESIDQSRKEALAIIKSCRGSMVGY